MKTANRPPLDVVNPWQTSFDYSNQKMTICLNQDLKKKDVENLVQFTHDMVRLLHVKTLFIGDNRVVENPLGLDWKIIEASWEAICTNGGNKIIVNHHSDLPQYVTKSYTNALKRFGIPIKLEINSKPFSASITNKNLNA